MTNQEATPTASWSTAIHAKTEGNVMAHKLEVRQERRLYQALSLEELDALRSELEPMGWSTLGITKCPDGCQCGEGPFWESYVLQLPTIDKKELN